MQFNYIIEGLMQTYDFDLYYDDYGVVYLWAKPLCSVFSLAAKFQTTRYPTNPLALNLGARQVGCWNLDTVSDFLSNLNINRVKNPTLVRHFKEHFLPYVQHQLAPKIEIPRVEEIYESLGSEGVGACRRFLANNLMLPPAAIAYAVQNGVLETVESTSVPYIEGLTDIKYKGVTIDRKVEYRFKPEDFSDKLWLPKKMTTLATFEQRNPEHALSQRPIDRQYTVAHYINAKGFEDLRPKLPEEYKPVAKPWDNQPNIRRV